MVGAGDLRPLASAIRVATCCLNTFLSKTSGGTSPQAWTRPRRYLSYRSGFAGCQGGESSRFEVGSSKFEVCVAVRTASWRREAFAACARWISQLCVILSGREESPSAPVVVLGASVEGETLRIRGDSTPERVPGMLGTYYGWAMPDAYYMSPRNAARYERDMRRVSDTVDDIPFYVDLARQAAEQGQAVLELGCGTGRVTIPIALAGAQVTGLDSSPAMLDIARERAEGAGVRVRWVEGDMADFDLAERFGLVVIPFRSFLHLTREDEQAGCLASIHRHLTAGGRLALNFYIAPAGAPGATRRSRVYRSMQLLYVSRSEMERLLSAAGFEVEALYGWFDGRDFGPESSEMVWLVRKRSTRGKY